MIKRPGRGLADWTGGRPPAKAAKKEAPAAAALQSRVKGDMVSMTVRLTRSQWVCLRQVALDEATSLQQIAMQGLQLALEKRGLKFR